MPENQRRRNICKRFDADLERFYNLETGQSTTIDAPLATELTTGMSTYRFQSSPAQGGRVLGLD